MRSSPLITMAIMRWLQSVMNASLVLVVSIKDYRQHRQSALSVHSQQMCPAILSSFLNDDEWKCLEGEPNVIRQEFYIKLATASSATIATGITAAVAADASDVASDADASDAADVTDAADAPDDDVKATQKKALPDD